MTELPSNGINTKDPINRPAPTTVGQPLCPNETPLDPGPTASVGLPSDDIFQPIESGGPAPSIPFRSDHIVEKRNIVDRNVPIQTNKFYANFFLGSQSSPVWTHPYSLTWAKGTGNSSGMAITHTVREQFAFGPNPESPQYFVSPTGIHHLVLSAAELGTDTRLSVENLQAFSVYANLAASGESRVLMSIPCVQGMGFVTALYDRAQPMIRSGVFFRTLNYISIVNGATHKYRLTLNDGSTWLLYATSIGSVGVPPFTLNDTTTITGPRDFSGMIQVTKNPSASDGEDVFDSSAGAYAINATITGSVSKEVGKYSLSWAKGGIQSQTLLMYALPHHVESFDQETQAALKNISLVTTTKGYATAVLADKITMVEDDLPVSIAFAPWAKAEDGARGGSGNINLQPAALSLINQAGITELGQDFDAQTRLNSMYYSGKGLAKFAAIIYVMNSMTGNSQYAAAGLDRLKDAFNVFVNNTQPEPLVYDQVWKGVVSSATYRPPHDTGLDFGNTLYNDHHFHYGYFVWTAAVIGHLDSSWLEEGSNKAWVNTLVRDFANPVNDAYYPFQRSFDWFHGHSWAKGLFESGDGKDQESTSEDTFATYALKMWGRIIRDPNMEARGNLQLAVQARSLRNYFLMTSNNTNQPPQFIPNKVTGILFENKIDHTTYFGGKPEYIEGIHMIPLNPSSAYTRSKQFVEEEWEKYFSNGKADAVEGGWKAIIYANLALIDPRKSYEFFSDPDFNTSLDGGASRTWYLAYSAAMLGANSASVVPDGSLKFGNSTMEGIKPLQTGHSVTRPPHTTHGDQPTTINSQHTDVSETHVLDVGPQKEKLQYEEPENTDHQHEDPKLTTSQYQGPQSTPSYNQEPQSTHQQHKEVQFTTSQYQGPQPTTSQYQGPQSTTSQYQDPRSTTSQYQGPQSTTSQYQGPQSTTSQYQGPQSTTSQYQGPQSATPQYQDPSSTIFQDQGPQPTTAQYQGPQSINQQHKEVQSTTSHHQGPQPTTSQYQGPQSTNPNFTKSESRYAEPISTSLQDQEAQVATTLSSLEASLAPSTSLTRAVWPVGFDWPKASNKPTPSQIPTSTPSGTGSVKPTFSWPDPTSEPSPQTTSTIGSEPSPKPTASLQPGFGWPKPSNQPSPLPTSTIDSEPVSRPTISLQPSFGWPKPSPKPSPQPDSIMNAKPSTGAAAVFDFPSRFTEGRAQPIAAEDSDEGWNFQDEPVANGQADESGGGSGGGGGGGGGDGGDDGGDDGDNECDNDGGDDGIMEEIDEPDCDEGEGDGESDES